MPANGFNYGQMMQRALRDMIASVLREVAENGLPSSHHFFVTFDTTHPGVDMAPWLKERYPKELTIVLQHEFRDLAVAGDRFSVTLSFSNRPEKIVVPFEALRTFVDPSCEFGLRFDPQEAAEDEPEPDPPSPPPKPSPGGDVVRLDRFRRS